MQKEEKYNNKGHEIVEISILLPNGIEYYKETLAKNGIYLKKIMYTHDQYWTDRDLSNMTGNEMKKSCVRYRESKKIKQIDRSHFKDVSVVHYEIDNMNLFDKESHSVRMLNINAKKAADLILPVANTKGWGKVFDTTKIDYQFTSENMESVLQLQAIQEVGLVLYYDNPKYYKMEKDEQRKALIDDLKKMGFDIDSKAEDFDKLRTLYKKKN